MKKTVLILAVLVTLAFAVRLVIAFNTYVISSDGPFYLSVAQDFANGDYWLALSKHYFHPLYPFLVAAASTFISNLEWAGMLVSIILSSLGIIPLYFITRKYFAGSIVIIAGLLYCFHPQGAQLSAAIFTTGTHISILLFALWVTILALETNKNIYFTLSGMLSFAMYLNRPDGLAFLGITLMGIMFISAVSRKEKGVKIVYLIIPWLLMLPPYLIAVKSVSGVIGLTGKVSAEAVIDMEITKSFEGIYQFVVEFVKGANPILFILFLIGAIRATVSSPYTQELGAKPGSPTSRPAFAWLVFAGFMAFFAVYAFTHGRMSKRYTVPLFLMMLPWTSAGIYYLGDLSERMFVRAGKISIRFTAKAVPGLVIIILLILSVFTFKPVGQDKVIEKTTGELLKKYHSARSPVRTVHPGGDAANQSPVIITTLSRVAYYAGGVGVMPDGWDRDKLKISDFLQSLNNVVRQKSADYLVLDGRIIRRFPELENELAKPFADNISVELISRYFGSPTASGNDKTADKYYKVYRFIFRAAPQENK